ncbi:hypothetical protein P0F39_003276 [Vibrio metschnikovii]|nr:hypothetical protein [Vibrio metschnikovii]EKO3691711.1 hypothetical protein [Vibrio metschnikovii]EKO3781685.1 hypothetical protein [Vibrio metschnikovii]EKO3888581.1 hypothetical protein [Vibrio metschnikovii]EKO3936960.1 hypothetical protein [Vibrio metschnikovii]
MQQTERVILKYDGDALQEHAIDIDVLAESLTGLASLLKEINIKINGTSDNLDVKVEALQPGSFEFVIDVIQNPAQYIDVLAIVGIGGAALAAGKDSLMSAMSKLEGRVIDKLSFTQDGKCKVTISDQEAFEVDPYLMPLLSSSSVRNSLSKLVRSPLKKDGIDVFQVLNVNRQEIISIDKEQSKSYSYRRVPVKNSTVDKPDLEEVPITFTTIHRDKTYGWRIDLEGENVTVSIKDDEFVTRVKAGKEPNLFSSAYLATLTVKEDLFTLDKTYIIDTVHGPLD